jgi:hypothetical protein
MHQAALDADTDPDRLSFVRSLRIVRRQLIAQAVFPPDQLARAARLALGEILAERLPVRRLRAPPRVVKPKMSNTTSNAPTTGAGPSQPDPPTTPSSYSAEPAN